MRSFVHNVLCLCLNECNPRQHSAFDCVRGSGPAYFMDVCIPVTDISVWSTSVPLNVEISDMVVPWTRTWSPELSRCSIGRLECPSCLYLSSTPISRALGGLNLKPISLTKPYDILWEHLCFNIAYSYCTYLLRRGAGPKIEWAGAEWKRSGSGEGAERSGERGLQKKAWEVSGKFSTAPAPLTCSGDQGPLLTWNYCYLKFQQLGSNVKFHEIFSRWKIQWTFSFNENLTTSGHHT